LHLLIKLTKLTDYKIYKGWSIPQNESHFNQYLQNNFKCDYQDKINNILKHQIKKKNNVAIDVGANIGMMSVRYCKSFDHVYSFEPISVNFQCLENNTKHLNNITLHKVGLGDVNVIETIYNKQDYDNSGGWSVTDWQDTKWMHYNKDTKLISENISINTLDSYNLKPDFIKIDTQGYELNVLIGAAQTISEYKPIILLELDRNKPKLKQKIQKFMTNNKYKLIANFRKDHLYKAK